MLGHAQSGLTGDCFEDLISPLLTLLAQRPAHKALVVDNEDFLGRHARLAYYGRAEMGWLGASGAGEVTPAKLIIGRFLGLGIWSRALDQRRPCFLCILQRAENG